MSLGSPTLLLPSHETVEFDCGKAPLNVFLKEHALSRQNARLSRTYVVTETGSQSVVAYYSLAHVTIHREDAPKKIGRGMPDTIPALLLARLAVDLKYQGRRLGSSMLGDALRRVWTVMEHAPAPVRFFIVDALDDEARAFYERMQMIPSPVAPMRLFLHYKDVEALFGPSR